MSVSAQNRKGLFTNFGAVICGVCTGVLCLKYHINTMLNWINWTLLPSG